MRNDPDDQEEVKDSSLSRRKFLATMSMGGAAAAGMWLEQQHGWLNALLQPGSGNTVHAAEGAEAASAAFQPQWGLPMPLLCFDHVEEMKQANIPAGVVAYTRSYYAGWEGSLLGPLGGAFYDIVSTADVTGSPDGFGDHLLDNGNVALLHKSGGLYATQYGARGDNGLTDSYPQLQAMVDQLKKQGGGTATLDWAGGAYGISETIKLWNDTTFGGPNWLKIMSHTTYDCAVLGVPGAKNVHITELKIDCDRVPAQGGVYLRRNNSEWHVGKVTVKNAAHDKSRKGGRALTCEAGVNPTVYGARKSTVDSVIAIDCYMGLCLAGGHNQEDTGVIINSVVAERCEIVIGMFGNAAGYPHSAANMQHVVQAVVARNCGMASTYSRPHAAIVSDRGSNVRIGGLSLHNDPAYGSIGALVMGDFSNVVISGATFFGDCSSLFLFSRFFEADTIADDVFATVNSEFVGIKHVGTCAEIAVSSKPEDAKVRHTECQVATDIVSSDRWLSPSMGNKTTVHVTMRNRQHNARIEGFANTIGSSDAISV